MKMKRMILRVSMVVGVVGSGCGEGEIKLEKVIEKLGWLEE